jgi:transposase
MERTTMRGMDEKSGCLFSYVDLEDRVPISHPLRAICLIVNEALADLTGTLEELYSPFGRPSIPPEQLLRAMLLQAFFSIRSERQLMERLDFDLSFRWFVGLGIDDAVWDHSTFSKNRDRLLDGDVAAHFLCAILERPKVKQLLSTEHFSVDGTLIEAWASMKSFKAKNPPLDDLRSDPGEPSTTEGRNPEVDFPSEARSVRTRRTPRRLIWTRGSTAKAQDKVRSCASSVMFSWRTATASWSTPNSLAPAATLSGSPRWRWSRA